MHEEEVQLQTDIKETVTNIAIDIKKIAAAGPRHSVQVSGCTVSNCLIERPGTGL